jgi:hypothetical protein
MLASGICIKGYGMMAELRRSFRSSLAVVPDEE